jgi:hypothetical protein
MAGSDLELHRYCESLTTLWNCVWSNPTLASLVDELQAKYPSAANSVELILNSGLGQTEDKFARAATGSYVVEACVNQGETANDALTQIMGRISQYKSFSEQALHFHKDFTQPLFDYLMEELKDQRRILRTLLKYRDHCEFLGLKDLIHFDRANGIAPSSNHEHAEAAPMLTRHLHHFLHTHGVPISIEESTSAQSPHRILSQSDNIPILVQAIVLDSSMELGINHLTECVTRIGSDLHPTEAYQYLVVFNVSDQVLKIADCDLDLDVPYFSSVKSKLYVIPMNLHNEYSYGPDKRKRTMLLTGKEITDAYMSIFDEIIRGSIGQ